MLLVGIVTYCGVEDPFKKHRSIRLVDQSLQHLSSAIRARARKGITHVLKICHMSDTLFLQSHRHRSLSDTRSKEDGKTATPRSSKGKQHHPKEAASPPSFEVWCCFHCNLPLRWCCCLSSSFICGVDFLLLGGAAENTHIKHKNLITHNYNFNFVFMILTLIRRGCSVLEFYMGLDFPNFQRAPENL